MEISLSAPAKLNIFFHIIGKSKIYKDYHNIESLVIFSKLSDEIIIQDNNKCELIITGPFAGTLNKKDNLIISAINLLKKHAVINDKIKITLVKNIPVAAGLGGGSSDAAVILNYLARNLNPAEIKLNEIAVQLGADIAVCLYQKNAFIRGIGEEITKLADNNIFENILLINPAILVSTKQIFCAYAESKPKYSNKITNLDAIYNPDFLKNCKNDLQEIACKLYPEIKELLDMLNKLPGCVFARMTGSGSTCFAIFSDKESLAAASIFIKNSTPKFLLF